MSVETVANASGGADKEGNRRILTTTSATVRMRITIIEETRRRCVEVVGDEDLCRKAVEVAAEAIKNRRVYVPGRPGVLTAWSAQYEYVQFGVTERDEVVIELIGHALPTIVIHVSKDRVRTEIVDENYLAMLNAHIEHILQTAQKIIKKT
jgi:hypothetical protein